MKRTIIAVSLTLFAAVGMIYLFLVCAVNDKKNDLEKFKSKIEADSVEYHQKKAGSIKKATP